VPRGECDGSLWPYSLISRPHYLPHLSLMQVKATAIFINTNIYLDSVKLIMFLKVLSAVPSAFCHLFNFLTNSVKLLTFIQTFSIFLALSTSIAVHEKVKNFLTHGIERSHF
jgi:hypothetical protein